MILLLSPLQGGPGGFDGGVNPGGFLDVIDKNENNDSNNVLEGTIGRKRGRIEEGGEIGSPTKQNCQQP